MAKTPSKKAAKTVAKTGVKGAKGKGKKRVESYSTYIYKVLRQVHPETGISKRGMSIMNSFINDIFERIASEAGKLSRYNKNPMVPDLLRVVPLKLCVRSATQVDGDAPMYEVFCRWRNQTLKADDSFTYTEWNVWKSYEAFQALDAELRAQRQCRFAKMMVTVAFAPEHRMRAFFHQDQTARFLEKRQKELDYYMQRILLFSGVAEFVAGTGSRVLAAFLDADQHVDCAALMRAVPEPTPPSPTAALLEQHSREALRTLNVDMHTAFSPSHSYASSTTSSFDKLGGGGGGGSARTAAKQEIEDELVLRFGEHQLKRFRKRAREFRKENDPTLAAQMFVKFVAGEYDAECASWVLQRFLKTVKSDEKYAALRDAAADSALLLLPVSEPQHHGDDDASRKMRKASVRSMKRTSSSLSNNASGSFAKLSRKQSSKEIMARVERYARGNSEHIEAFKVAAKALGSQEMTTAQFVAFVRTTFGRDNSKDILYLVVDVVPLPHVQRELRELLAI
ncbi:hypothetical protein PybrP1_009662 [[Pythium] brassicae (nom. inval.)]|nr:hypothetical protein PybrP1_009662 [[Pythium] brassicae (nom. inval.)]